jgi:hypothetical protein
LVRVLPGVGQAGRRVAVVFCRVGLWAETNGAVLFLERTRWHVDGVPVCRARRVGTAGETPGTDDATVALEDVVLEAVREGWGERDDQLPATIAEVVYHRWLELFDFLEPLPQTLCGKTAACYAQMMRSLELNIETDDDIPWDKLLERIQRRVALLSALPTRTPISPPATHEKASNTLQHRTVSQAATMRSDFYRRRRGRGHKTPTDENQRALDRLSYLGGILIPLPIISGILSMGDAYGPDGSKFFVFWAVAIPLAALTVLLIYADTIRKAQVWVEIGPEHVIPTPEGKSENRSGAHVGPIDVEVKRRRTVTWRRHQVHRDHEQEEQPSPRQRDDVVFAVDHDVEERMIDMPPAAAAAATVYSSDEEVLDRMPPSARRWSMGWGNVPSVILEQPSDGSKPRAWMREELGWRGAVQTILYKKFRDGDDVPEGVAASEKPGRRKTKSY